MLRIAILVMIIGLSATGVYNNAYDLSLIKKYYLFFISFSAMLVANLISKSSKSFSFYVLLEWIIYVTIVQGLISIFMYFDRNLQEYIIGHISSGMEQENFMEVQAAFRVIALCKFQYANMAVMYGLALFSAISLGFSNKSTLYQHKILYKAFDSVHFYHGDTLCPDIFLMIFSLSFIILIYCISEKVFILLCIYY